VRDVGIVVAVGLLLATASSAGGAGPLRGRLVLECDGIVRTMHPARPARGHCTVSGAITDQGTFVDSGMPGVHPHARSFIGSKGTIRISVYRMRGHWKIIRGNRAYAGLRGGGWESSSPRCPRTPAGCGILFSMHGTVQRP
jgi:hypothetical protein